MIVDILFCVGIPCAIIAALSWADWFLSIGKRARARRIKSLLDGQE